MPVTRDDIEEFISDRRGHPQLEAVVTTFGRLLYQHGPFDLPRYQRAYCWKATPNWRDFLADWTALAFAERNAWLKTNNFLGAIVVSRADARAAGRIGLLDGQQRLLTACIALKALAIIAASLDMKREREVIDQLLWTANREPTINPSLANAFDFMAALRKKAADFPGSPLASADPTAAPSTGNPSQAPEDDDAFLDDDAEEDAEDEDAEERGEADDAEELSTRLQRALGYFHRRLCETIGREADRPAAVRALMKALMAYTRIVVIKLAPGDDGLEIFDRLNSRAELLSMLDRLKVVLLEAARQAEADPTVGVTRDQILYQDHWAPVFESPERVEFWDEPAQRFKDRRQHQDWLMRVVLSARKGKRVDGSNALIEVRQLLSSAASRVGDQHADNENGEAPGESRAQLAERLIRSLCEQAASYAAVNGSPQIERHGAQIDRIRLFSRFAAEPLVVSLYTARRDDDAALTPILDMLESIAVRRFFDQQGSVRDYELYSRLCAAVDARSPLSGVALAADFHRRMKAIGRKWRYWTTDRDFLHNVQHRTLVDRKAGPQAKERKQLFKLVFALLDAHAQGRPEPTPELADPRFTVEHIYPINGHEAWPPLRADRDWLIRIGNLTMVDNDLNREMGDQAWPIKRSMIGERCSIHLNRRLVDNEAWRDTWGAEQIRARGLELAQLAVTRWPGPDAHEWPQV